MRSTNIDARRLLRRHGVRPNKRLGQNFLVDGAALRDVVSAAALSGEELVLEIGAGFGALTRELAQHAGQVIAVELDQRLMPALREVVHGLSSVHIVEGDVLAMDLKGLVGEQAYCVVANIPYNITSALMRKLVEASSSPYRIVLTVQREVAERATAAPGKMSLLALAVQIFGRPAITTYLPASVFYPRPEVESAVLRIERHEHPPFALTLVEPVFRLARAGFSQRRKMLKNTLSAALGATKAGVVMLMDQAQIASSARPQELSVTEWAELAEAYLSSGLT